MDLNTNRGKLNKVRIIMADDHPLIRQALRMWIEKHHDLEIIAEADNGSEVVEISAKLNPDVVIMDVSMPKLNGLEATRQIKKLCPNTEILALTVYSDDEHVRGMIQAGVSGYLTKNISGEEIVHAVRALADGENLLPPAISRKIITDNLSSTSTVASSVRTDLTDRELTILKMVADGMSNKSIARELDLSLGSVKSNLTTLFLKMGVSSRTGAISAGLKAHILSLTDLK